jgi:L-threonylcarbamoyladenylate synthase
VSKSVTESSKANAPSAEALAAAVAALAAGRVIVFPTETLYGIGADALNPSAVERVFALKGRDAANPIPVLVQDRAMLSQLVTAVPPVAEKLIARFWPGPLTIVLPARPDIPAPLVNQRGGIGVRISSQPIAAALVNQLGRPITATSANPSGQAPARTAAEAIAYFSGEIEIFIDGGALASKTGSTVIEAVGGEHIRIIRQGDLSKSALAACLGAEKILH